MTSCANNLHTTHPPATAVRADMDIASRRFIRVSPGFCDATGYTEAELLGMRVIDLTPPEDRASEESRLQQALGSDQCNYRLHMRCLRKDGAIGNIEVYGRVLRDPSDYPAAAVEIAIGVTPEQPLAQTEPLSASILESLHDQIAVIDRSGMIICTNSAWQRFAERNDVADISRVSAGVNYLEVCRRAAVNDDGQAKKALEGIEAILDGLSQRFTIEYECSSPDEKRWFMMTVSPLYRSCGGAVITHRDVTHRREATRRLRDSYDEIVRLKGELQQQLRFEALISEVSARFVNVLNSEVDGEIARALQQILRFFNVDRSALFEISPDGNEIRLIHTVVVDGVPPVPPVTEGKTRSPRTFAHLIQAGEPLCLDSLEQLPEDALLDRQSLADRGVKSIALIPISVGNKVRYFISVAAVREACVWPPGIAPRLQLLGETFVNAITRRAMESAQNQLLAFQSLIAEISARFVHLASDALDEEINCALNRILLFFGADQCGIFKLDPANGEAHLSYVRAAEGVSPAPLGAMYAERFPWAIRELNEGRVVSFSKLDDLPADAEADKRAFARCGLAAGLNIPISTGGHARFAFGISCNRPHTCPAEYIPRLRLLGETLANAVIRSEAEEASKTANTRLEYALNATAHGMWDWNIQTGEVYYSTNWIQSLGYTREEVPAHVSFWESLVHPDDMPRVRKALLAHFKGDTPIYRVENRLRLKSGDYRWNVDHGRVVERAADGTPLRMVGTDTDITEQKHVQSEMRAMRDRLWHMDRVARIGMLSASIAHEINQPLAAILSNAQAAARFLAKPSVDLDEIREIIEDIERDDKRAGAVIASLRAMLAGQAHHREELDLAEVARSVLNILHSELLVAHIKVKTRLRTRCLVCADKTQLQQVILNLIMNAVESMQDVRADSRTMSVSVHRTRERRIVFSVRDTGPGIAREKLDQIFEPFLTTKAEGMGLGLAVSRSIIEAHSGRIWAENHEGGGAVVFFELPMPEAEDAAVAARR